MKSRMLALGAGFTLLLILLLAQAPARLLSAVVPAEQLTLHGLSGTLWRGRAARAVVATPRGPLHLGAVTWRLKPLSLVLFSPTLELDSRWGGQRANGDVTLRGAQDIDLREFEMAAAADLAQQFLPLQLRGLLSAQIDSLSVRDGQPVSGSGRLVWRDASWLAPQGPLLLGSYGLDFEQTDGEALRGEVVTIAGPISAEGTVQLRQRDYLLDLTIAGEGGLDPQVSQALSLLADRDPDGSYRVQLDGSL